MATPGARQDKKGGGEIGKEFATWIKSGIANPHAGKSRFIANNWTRIGMERKNHHVYQTGCLEATGGAAESVVAQSAAANGLANSLCLALERPTAQRLCSGECDKAGR